MTQSNNTARDQMGDELAKRPPHPSKFVRWLEEQGVLPDLDDQFTELTRTVIEIGRKGEIYLKVALKPSGDGRIKALPAITVKAPQYDREERTFFANEKGELMRNNPKQRNVFKLQSAEPEKPATAPPASA